MKLWQGGRRSVAEAAFLVEALTGDEPQPRPRLIEIAQQVRDWNRVAALALWHGVAPWALASLLPTRSAAVPADVYARLRTYAAASAFESLSLTRAFEEVARRLSAERIPLILLKGPAVAEKFYPDPALRPYGDIDVLVSLADHDRVSAVCSELGYDVHEDHGGVGSAAHGTCESPLEIKYVHRQTGLHLEVHYDHLQVGLTPRSLKDLWERCEIMHVAGTPVRVLGLNDLFLLLCVHLNKHGYSRLIWFKDLDLVLRRHGGELDWEWLEATARDEGAAGSMGYTLRLLRKLLDTPTSGYADRFAQSHGGHLFHRLLWPEKRIMELTGGRWRRAVQFVPNDGLRGAIPALLVMGRRGDKIRALRRRLLRL